MCYVCRVRDNLIDECLVSVCLTCDACVLCMLCCVFSMVCGVYCHLCSVCERDVWMLAMHMSGNAGHLFTDIALMVIGKAVDHGGKEVVLW